MEIILNDVETRVLGSLIEKDVTTPDYYPLSLNALVNACNQKNNRDPVMTLDEEAVRQALNSLQEKRLAGPTSSADVSTCLTPGTCCANGGNAAGSASWTSPYRPTSPPGT